MQPNDAAIRKRMQIAKTNRAMFLWIAGASAIIGAAIVVGIFLVQKLVYNEQVIAKKQETITTLDSNLRAVDTLKEEIRLLDVNEALLNARASDDDQAIQVILDALPSDANSLALGASLQNKLLAGIPGLTLETLQVDPVLGLEVISDDGEIPVGEDGYYQITFALTVSGSQEALRQVLLNLEKSIRTIEVTSLRIDGQTSGDSEMNIQGRAFYEPAKVLEFTEEQI